MKILILDNFDSFTYNLHQLVGEILQTSNTSFSIDVRRNNAITINEVAHEKYDRIIISPGPGTPLQKKYFGVCTEVLKTVSRSVPTLGVCLGMQGIAHVYGGKVGKAKFPMHGKTSLIRHDGKGIFSGLAQNLEAMRYHSLIVEKISSELEVTATSEKEIMGLRHKKFPIEGVQFHPESFATEKGREIIRNFLFTDFSLR